MNGPGSDDVRARIRDAALAQFAEHGFKGATVRGIAEAAGVSPGLVQHHFRSKQALREECDRHVLHVLTGMTQQVGGAPIDEAFVSGTHRAVSAVVPYLALSLVSEAPASAAWFDRIADLYERLLTSGELGTTLPDTADREAIVAVYSAMQLGLAVLAGHVFRRMASDGRDPAAVVRLARARLYLATERTVGPQVEAQLRSGLERYAGGESDPVRDPGARPGDHPEDREGRNRS